jgi:acetyl esterase
MPLDPKVKEFLYIMKKIGAPPVSSMTPEEARRSILDKPKLPFSPPPISRAADSVIPGPGGDLTIRVYTPEGKGPFPILIFSHGGGFVLGNLDTHDPVCRNLCAGAGCVVVAVDYRLAPENKFPAATDDCLAATCWAAENAEALGGDPNRICVGGDSAGANLSTVTAMRIRDEGGPNLRGQLLVYPLTDYHTPGTPSIKKFAGLFLTWEEMVWFAEQYIGDPSEIDHPHVHPLRARDLSDLPPALVMTAEYDPLRDEGERYAERMASRRVPVRHIRYNGMIHGFFGFLGIFDQAEQAHNDACGWLKNRFA